VALVSTPVSEATKTATHLPSPPKSNPADGKCCGPNCVDKTVDALVRNCRTCTHYWCKSCCQKYQHLIGTQCKEPWHAVEIPSSESGGTNTSSSGSMATNTKIQWDEFYDPTKPLTKDHYDSKQRAAQNWQEETDQILQIKQQQDCVKKNIVIIFWKEVSLI